jgi:hypothetical protein
MLISISSPTETLPKGSVDMNIDPGEIENILNLLRQTSDRIAHVSMQFNNEQLTLKPDAAEWSANDILAHLRSCADVWGKSMLLMIAQDWPTLRYISPCTWIKKKIIPRWNFVYP